ncbi:MAG: ribosome-associated translation inhibitor RaiA [Candidatus Nomurabacteria bacterium]|nr:ribosome-associated translation inhibitor RaiA [Candidatus Nomurabacteria bacterium]
MKIIEITAKHFTIDSKIRSYIERKTQKLIDYIPRHARKSARISVKITKNEARGAAQLECEMILNLPNRQLVAKESKDGVLAAIDGTEEKMRGQIRKYKVELEKAREENGILNRVKAVLRRR